MLNDLTIRKLSPPALGVAQYPDGSIPGFGVRVTAKGIRSFYLAYRHHGKNRRLNLGRYPTIKLQKARAKAFAALAELEDGRDPSGESVSMQGFAVALEAFVEGHCKRYNRPSTAAETERLLRVYFLPAWKQRAVDTIKKSDIAATLEPIIKRGSQMAARHAFAAIRKMFNWMVEQGAIETSPCLGMKPPGKASSRDRVMLNCELQTIWKAAVTIGYPFGPIVQVLMFTAQRRGEVSAMMWKDVDIKEKIWTIPGERTKNGKPHTVPLTVAVIKIIAEIPRASSPFVFPARGKPEQPYSGYSKGKRNLDAVAELHDWTLHDLRRTAATGMARNGIAPHVVERVLNHASGTFAGVAGIYNRFNYLPEMREALERWSEHVEKITASGPTESDTNPVATCRDTA